MCRNFKLTALPSDMVIARIPLCRSTVSVFSMHLEGVKAITFQTSTALGSLQPTAPWLSALPFSLPESGGHSAEFQHESQTWALLAS